LTHQSQYRTLPAKEGEIGAYKRYNPKPEEPDVWHRYERNFAGLYRWPGAQGVVIPKDRRSGAYNAAPTARRPGTSLQQDAWVVQDLSNKMQNYNQWISERKVRVMVQRKLRNAVRSVLGKPQLAIYLTNLLNGVLARRDMQRVVTNDAGRVYEMQLEELAAATPLAEEYQIPELEVGARQSRFLNFDEYTLDS
jgi:hypothetical protein